MQIRQFFLNGDIKGAIAYMRDHEEFRDEQNSDLLMRLYNK